MSTPMDGKAGGVLPLAELLERLGADPWTDAAANSSPDSSAFAIRPQSENAGKIGVCDHEKAGIAESHESHRVDDGGVGELLKRLAEVFCSPGGNGDSRPPNSNSAETSNEPAILEQAGNAGNIGICEPRSPGIAESHESQGVKNQPLLRASKATLERLLKTQGEGVFQAHDGGWMSYALGVAGKKGKKLITGRYGSLNDLAADLSTLPEYPADAWPVWQAPKPAPSQILRAVLAPMGLGARPYHPPGEPEGWLTYSIATGQPVELAASLEELAAKYGVDLTATRH